MKFEKTFDFSKIDYNGTGRKINKITVDARLVDHNEKLVFAAMGEIWNSKCTDIIRGGQCLDEIAKHVYDPLFKKLYGWWKKYHWKTDIDIPEDELDEMKSVLSCQS